MTALANFPAELRERPQWVAHVGKVPHVAGTKQNGHAKSTDPTTWRAYPDALQALTWADGLGYALAGEVTVIDLDHCVQDGELHPAARAIVDRLGSYAELSPSGTGVHVWTRATLPGSGRKTTDTEWGGGMEVYDSARYMTVTGEQVPGTPDTIEPRQAAVDALLTETFPEALTDPGDGPLELDEWEQEVVRLARAVPDDQLLAHAREAGNGAKFAAVWDDHAPSDRSRHDAQLAGLLVWWTGPDPERLRDLIAKAPGTSEKWGRTWRYACGKVIASQRERGDWHVWEAPPPPTTGEAELGEYHVLPTFPLDVLSGPMRELVWVATAAQLPAALVAAPALGAAAAAIGSSARIQIEGLVQRAILWPVGVGPPGCGKSPGQSLAFEPLRQDAAAKKADYRDALRAWQALDMDGRVNTPRPTDRSSLIGDTTIEGLARTLDARDGEGLCLERDELAGFLNGLGQYKPGKSGDRAKLLELWSGTPWDVTRVGKGGAANEVELYIAEPTVVVVGTLQPERLNELGTPEDGQQPRWLLHAVGLSEPSEEWSYASTPVVWTEQVKQLLALRDTPRQWTLSEDATRSFKQHALAWKQAASGTETTSTSAALLKADTHCLRLALVLAELEAPGAGGLVSVDVIERAARWVDYTLDCWRAQAVRGGLHDTYASRVYSEGVDALRAWIEARGGRVRRRDAQRARVSGARKPEQFKRLVAEYEATYPGCVIEPFIYAPTYNRKEDT
jgi:hypothetical protein